MNLDDVLSQRIFTVMGDETLSDEVKSREMEQIEADINNAHIIGQTSLKPIHLVTDDDLFNVDELKRLFFPEDIGCEPIDLIW